MGKLIYNITTSLDGYVADSSGNFGWAEPSEEVHTFINGMLGNAGTFILGRSMYQTMAVWDSLPVDDTSAAVNNFAKIWRAANKIVYSTTLTDVSTKDTRLEHSFDPEAIRELKQQSSRDLHIGGPHLAAAAMQAHLIDEYHQSIVPVIIGEGTLWLPKDSSLKLKLIDVRKFENGTVHLAYRPV